MSPLTTSARWASRSRLAHDGRVVVGVGGDAERLDLPLEQRDTGELHAFSGVVHAVGRDAPERQLDGLGGLRRVGGVDLQRHDVAEAELALVQFADDGVHGTVSVVDHLVGVGASHVCLLWG